MPNDSTREKKNNNNKNKEKKGERKKTKLQKVTHYFKTRSRLNKISLIMVFFYKNNWKVGSFKLI